MYRDDACAVCGESLPPDHFYCRRHGAEVDARLHRVGEVLAGLLDGLAVLADLLPGVAQETWDYLAEQQPDDPAWPPAPAVLLRADAEDIDVDVDSEPGMVAVHVRVELPHLVAALAAGLDHEAVRALAAACRRATGADATH